MSKIKAYLQGIAEDDYDGDIEQLLEKGDENDG